MLEWEESVPAFLRAVRRGVRHLEVAQVAILHHVRGEVVVGDHDAFGETCRAGRIVDCCNCRARCVSGEVGPLVGACFGVGVEDVAPVADAHMDSESLWHAFKSSSKVDGRVYSFCSSARWRSCSAGIS